MERTLKCSAVVDDDGRIVVTLDEPLDMTEISSLSLAFDESVPDEIKVKW